MSWNLGEKNSCGPICVWSRNSVVCHGRFQPNRSIHTSAAEFQLCDSVFSGSLDQSENLLQMTKWTPFCHFRKWRKYPLHSYVQSCFLTLYGHGWEKWLRRGPFWHLTKNGQRSLAPIFDSGTPGKSPQGPSDSPWTAGKHTPGQSHGGLCPG